MAGINNFSATPWLYKRTKELGFLAQSSTSDRLKRLLQQLFRVGVPTYPKKQTATQTWLILGIKDQQRSLLWKRCPVKFMPVYQ